MSASDQSALQNSSLTESEESSSPLPSATSSTASEELPQLTKSIRRPWLKTSMIRNLVARRYGSLHDFSKIVARWCDIGRATGVNPETCRKAIGNFHRRGNDFKPRGARFSPGPRARAVSAELEAELTSKRSLYALRFLSMARRRELVQREHNIRLGKHTLTRMYKRNGIKYLQAKKKKRQTPAAERGLELQRIAFARRLHALQQN